MSDDRLRSESSFVFNDLSLNLNLALSSFITLIYSITSPQSTLDFNFTKERLPTFYKYKLKRPQPTSH